ncbi:MAG: 50S ribosomal protein L9 [Phycisphaerae bacterium]|nr:50S ribosomal protein L9 [Phycisphaerae bacterium]
MKVLLLKNISKLGKIGDVVEVKTGHARNYLLPQGLATEPTEANLKAIEAEKQRHLEELASQREQFEARAAAVKGKEVTIAARANTEGLLYGSVGPAQIAAALAEEGIFVEAENILMDAPLHRLDRYELQVQFAEDITATVVVWIVPVHDAEDQPSQQLEQAPEARPEGETPAEKE